MCTSTPTARSRSRLADGFRSLPDTRWPIRARTWAIALIPAPPTPTTWMRRVPEERSSAGSTTGVRLDQVGHPLGRVGSPDRRRRLPHRREPAGIAEELVDDGDEPAGGQLVVGHDHRGAGPLEHAGVG